MRTAGPVLSLFLASLFLAGTIAHRSETADSSIRSELKASLHLLQYSAGLDKGRSSKASKGNDVTESRRSWVSLDMPKRLWASGFDAKFPSVPQQPPRGEWLTWTPEAEEIFARMYKYVHFPAEGCEKRAKRVGFFSARTDMEWGVTSVIRDVQDQLLYGLLMRKPVAFSNHVADDENIKDAMNQYHQECGGSGVWMQDCYFEPLTGCTDDYLAGKLPLEKESLDRRVLKVTSEPAWFLDRSQPIWDKMVKANAVQWHSNVLGDHNVSHDAARWSSFVQVDLKHMEQGVRNIKFRAAQRLAMFRAMLLKVAFRPNRMLRHAIRGVEMRTGLPNIAAAGPITVVHVRRTDKSKDFIGGTQSQREVATFMEGASGVAGTLSTFSDTLLPWLEGVEGKEGNMSLFVMSDDWHVFAPEALDTLTRGMKARPKNVIFDEKSREVEPQDDKTLQMGNEAWGNEAAQGLYILAASFAAGKWANDILGCGSSGVSQLIAQLVGGRMRVDPNSVGMWEDDHVDTDAIRRGQDGGNFLELDLQNQPSPRERGGLWDMLSEAAVGAVSLTNKLLARVKAVGGY